MTEWRDVPGYVGLYQASRSGQVQGLRRGRLLALVLGARGYLHVNLYRDGVVKHHLVHRVVASAWLGAIPPGKQVNHKDGVKTNNRLSNLEVVTPDENRAHAKRHGLMRRGEDNPKAKLTEEQVRDIRRLRQEGVRVRDIGIKFDISERTVYSICSRQTWRHVA